MHFRFSKLFDLQFFGGEGAGAASGAGDGAGDGAASGVSPADAGQENDSTISLENKGVPKDKLEKFKASKARRGVQTVQEDAPVADNQPAQNVAQPEAQEEKPAARDFDSEFQTILDTPEFNQRIQDIIAKRAKKINSFVEDLGPALEILGDKYGIDASDLSKIDAKALSKAIVGDKSLYEEMADKMGTDPENAMKISQKNREAERIKRQAEDVLQQQAFNQHMDRLRSQAAVLKQNFPDFDLNRELQNERFRKMTSPSGGLSVEDAYFAIHHREISQAQATANAQRAAQALSNSIQSGRSVPAQNGATGKTSAPVANKLYSQMTPSEREAYKKRLISGRR